tara:strand:+ start:1881 stop:2504 length:624 start_codon:yes stop_codon:yes gene_type:complete
MATYSYPISYPTAPNYSESRFQLERLTGVTESPFTGSQQTFSYEKFSKWSAVLTLPPMKRAQAAEWQAFFLKLRGRHGTFSLGDPDATSPQGAVAGTILVNNGSGYTAGTTTIATDGYTNADSTVVFKAGDYIQIGTTLHQIVNDATCTSGAANLDFEPALKSSVADDAAITYTNPKGIFRLDSNQVGWDANKASTYGFTFACSEAF